MPILNNGYKPKYYVSPEQVHSELRKYMLVDGFDFVLDLEKSKGSKYIDARTGKKYLDFFTCFASMPLGLNHPKMDDKAFREYIMNAALNKISNADIYTSEMATFVKTFFKVAVPGYFKYTFFIEGGALAVENALKAAIDWKVRLNFRKGFKFECGHKIIHFKKAFHGRSGYTMSLTNTEPRKVELYPKFDWPRISNPAIIFPMNDENLELTIKKEKIAIEQIKNAIQNSDCIAAIIIEPIQGEGGDNHFRSEFLKELRQIADDNEIMLIFDEVQTGLGLTGTMWAHEQLEVKPDILVFGKKMQVCGILVTERIDEVKDNVFQLSSRINSTWGGNIIDMVRSTKYLEIIEEENLLDNVKSLEKPFFQKMMNLNEEYPDLISNVRNRGLFGAFDMPSDEVRKMFIERCFEEGLFILGCGDKSIRFRPALNITLDEIEEGFDIIRASLDYIRTH